MQVTETKTEGLTREFAVVVPAADIELKITERLSELAREVRLPGFRPGKVPVTLLRQRYGASIMGEVLEKAVNDVSAQTINERSLRPALQPKIEITKFEEGGDLEFTMALEILPDIEPMDLSTLKLERKVVEIEDSVVDESLQRLADSQKGSAPVSGSRKAKNGDIVVIDFVGKIEGEPFPGGKADGYSLELGSGSFIPGFEEQLVGTKAGDEVEVSVSFPEEYGAAELAGKAATFDVKVNELREPVPAAIDDDLAKKVGLESLDKLKEMFRSDHDSQLKSISRMHLKRDLLDVLAEKHEFEVPQGLVDNEYEAIWSQFEEQRKEGKVEDPDLEGRPDEEIQEDFREAAERRVRLGLLFAEIGQRNNIKVSQEDINRAMANEARRYPGQEQAVIEYFRKNPDAMQQLSGPLFEEKVVDFVIEMADVSDKTVTADELLKAPEADEADEAEKKPAAKKKAPAKKKAAAKKTAAKEEKGEEA